MNKTKLSWLLCLPLLLSCSIPSNDSEQDSSDSASSSIDDDPVIEDTTVEEAYSLLKKLAIAESYKVSSCLYTDNAYSDWLTPSYYYSTGLGSGYLLKESYDKSYGDSIVYSFKIEDEEIKLGSPKYSYAGGALQYVNDLSSLYAFSSYGEFKDKIDLDSFSSSSFGIVYSENRYVIKLFSASIGYADEESLKLITRVRFYKLGNNLGFVLQGSSGNSFIDYPQTWSLFEDIDDVYYPTIDDYLLKHYYLGKKMVERGDLSLFELGDKTPIKLHNELHVYIDNLDQGVNMASELLLTTNRAERISINPVDESKTSDLLTKKGDYAYEIGYDEEGKVAEKLYEKYLSWDDIVPDLVAKILSEQSCYRLEDGVYNYYGRLANRMKDFFGQMDDLNAAPERFCLTVGDDDKVNGARFEFPLATYQNDGESFIYRFVLESKIVSDLLSFTVLEDLPASSKISELDAAFAYFNGSSAYRVSTRDSLSDYDSEIITYADDIYYDERVSLLFSGDYKITAEGYFQAGEKLRYFIKTDDGSFYSQAPDSESHIEENLPHSLSSALFIKNVDGSYSFRDHVLPYASRGLPLSQNASAMLVDTAKLTLKDGKISTISYTYEWDILNNRKEEATFLYEDISISDEMKSALLTLAEFKEPTSWEEENPSILADLKKIYGEEANNIPYVYLSSTYKKWSSSYITGQVQLSNDVTKEVDAAFYEAYRSALLAKGFELAITPSLPGAEEYNLGKIKVRLAKILKGGLYFSVNE